MPKTWQKMKKKHFGFKIQYTFSVYIWIIFPQVYYILENSFKKS